VRGDPQIIVANHLSLNPVGANRAVSFRRCFRQGRTGRTRASSCSRSRAAGRCALFSAPYRSSPNVITESAASPGRSLRKRARTLLRPFPPDVDADVCVQQEARLHHSPCVLRPVPAAPRQFQIIREPGQQIEGAPWTRFFRAGRSHRPAVIFPLPGFSIGTASAADGWLFRT